MGGCFRCLASQVEESPVSSSLFRPFPVRWLALGAKVSLKGARRWWSGAGCAGWEAGFRRVGHCRKPLLGIDLSDFGKYTEGHGGSYRVPRPGVAIGWLAGLP